MAGGLMQLVAYGAQDLYLTGNPQITFFKVVYRRHTNFAVESIEQYFSGSSNFARKSGAEISRNGDLVTQIVLKITLPEVKYCGNFQNFGHVKFAWTKNIGHAIIEETELEVGGTLIDKHYGDWLRIWKEVSGKIGHDSGIDKMLGNVPDLTEVSELSWDKANENILKPSYTLFVPLQFSFCRNNGLALPLIALQYHQVKVYVKYRPLEQTYIASDAFKDGCEKLELGETSLLVNYIYLDTEERRRFAQVSHEYLIEQLQHSGEEPMSGSSGKFKLNFNHPVKALYWVVKMGNYLGGRFMAYQPNDWEKAREEAAKSLLLAQFDLDDFGYFNEVAIDGDDNVYHGDNGVEYIAINPADSSEEPQFIFNDTETAQRFTGESLIGKLSPRAYLLKRGKSNDLRDKVEGVIRINTDTHNDNYVYPEVEKLTRNDLTIADLSIPMNKYDHDNRTDSIKKDDLTVWQHDNYGLLIDGSINPVTEAELQLNGQIRQSKRSGFWYDTVEPYLKHSRSPKDGLNVFSFALNPEEHQPSCTCNFSRIDNSMLNLWFSDLSSALSDVFMNTDTKILIFATNYNVMRILSGMAGLAYAN